MIANRSDILPESLVRVCREECANELLGFWTRILVLKFPYENCLKGLGNGVSLERRMTLDQFYVTESVLQSP